MRVAIPVDSVGDEVTCPPTDTDCVIRPPCFLRSLRPPPSLDSGIKNLCERQSRRLNGLHRVRCFDNPTFLVVVLQRVKPSYRSVRLVLLSFSILTVQFLLNPVHFDDCYLDFRNLVISIWTSSHPVYTTLGLQIKTDPGTVTDWIFIFFVIYTH